MRSVERLSLLHKVASLYYEKRLKKYDIASIIKQSPTQVGLLLKEAIEEGIVTINVVLPRFTVLQEKLKKKFGLVDAVVVPSDKDISILLKNLSQATVRYFEENVSDTSKIAVGSGLLTYQMIDELIDRVRNIDIFPLAIVGRGPVNNHIDSITLVTLLWAKSGRQLGRAHYITVTPPDFESGEDDIRRHYENLKNNADIKKLLMLIENVDYVFTSIGSLNADKNYTIEAKKTTQNLLDELKISKDTLREEGAVGDIVYSFFDAFGSTKPEWNFFPGLDISQLKKMSESKKKKIVITAGKYKMDSLRATLEGKICNVLITDADAAAELTQTKKIEA